MEDRGDAKSNIERAYNSIIRTRADFFVLPEFFAIPEGDFKKKYTPEECWLETGKPALEMLKQASRLFDGHIIGGTVIEKGAGHYYNTCPVFKSGEFVTGHRKKFWNKNVVSIGLASGFMEPLESTSIHLIHSAINKLMLIFSLEGVQPQQEKIFNRLSLKEFEKIRDFLILHYNATTRTDSEFWNYCRTMDVPESLTEKIELFRLNGQIFREEDELFTATSWAAVMLGQGIQPSSYSPLVDALDQERLVKEVGEMEKSVKYVVYYMPTHAEFLSKYCPARKPA